MEDSSVGINNIANTYGVLVMENLGSMNQDNVDDKLAQIENEMSVLSANVGLEQQIIVPPRNFRRHASIIRISLIQLYSIVIRKITNKEILHQINSNQKVTDAYRETIEALEQMSQRYFERN